MPDEKKTPKPLVYNATITSLERLTESLSIFRVQPDEPIDKGADNGSLIPEFIAGQYSVLGLNNEAKPEKGPVRRAYSIASPPEERRWLEFYIRYVTHPESDNPLTHLLWKLNEGGRIWLGPKIVGKFTVAGTIGDDDPRMKIFVAAGTGLAPFVAIVKNQFMRRVEEKKGLDNLVILHGASHPDDLGYKEDLDLIMNQVQQRYETTVSRPAEHPDWEGHSGRVESFFDVEELETLEQRLGFEPGFITPETCAVFVCGLQGTIAQTLISLLHRGFIPEDKKIREALHLPDIAPPSLFFEQYDSTPILDLNNEEFLMGLRKTFPDGLD